VRRPRLFCRRRRDGPNVPGGEGTNKTEKGWGRKEAAHLPLDCAGLGLLHVVVTLSMARGIQQFVRSISNLRLVEVIEVVSEPLPVSFLAFWIECCVCFVLPADEAKTRESGLLCLENQRNAPSERQLLGRSEKSHAVS